ncbi:CIS tube protein [Anthocerotibacter panamensis]|uniref:CIS tube protein n=1 Tax=Anthocerotibacter panamensis TaxID=2857077 RepID=UPI001C403AB9|nr:hypothetical protein [Anthocerotibacter panamensis]
MTLAKAQLIPVDGRVATIKFMYNPSEISFSRSNSISGDGSARTEDQGKPKVSFSKPTPCSVSVSNIIFDAYEVPNGNVLFIINDFNKALEFVTALNRPPIYFFSWGQQNFLRCFVEQFSYQLTMFRPDGTPVRAKASLTLKEVDAIVAPANVPVPLADAQTRSTDTRSSRTTPTTQNRG